MKKIVLNLNRGWYVVLSMMCVFVIAAISFVACHNESDPIPADEGIEYLISENAEVIVGFAWVMKSAENDKILTTTDGNIAVALSASARPFYLPKDIRHYQEYYDLITTEREPNILKLTIGDKTDKGFPIIQVELPDEESEEYLEAKARWDNSESVDIGTETKSTTSLSEYVTFFKMQKGAMWLLKKYPKLEGLPGLQKFMEERIGDVPA